MTILAYAKANRLRIRNLHDGFPVTPMTRKRGTAKSTGYRGDHSHDVVVCKHGYVDDDGWTLLTKSKRQCLALLKRLPGGCIVRQLGDAEASGSIPGGLLPMVLRWLRARRV